MNRIGKALPHPVNTPVEPSQADLPKTIVDPTVAMRKALNNRAESTAYRRRLQEAERDVAQARGENGLNVNLFATYGLTNQAEGEENILHAIVV